MKIYRILSKNYQFAHHFRVDDCVGRELPLPQHATGRGLKWSVLLVLDCCDLSGTSPKTWRNLWLTRWKNSANWEDAQEDDYAHVNDSTNAVFRVEYKYERWTPMKGTRNGAQDKRAAGDTTTRYLRYQDFKIRGSTDVAIFPTRAGIGDCFISGVGEYVEQLEDELEKVKGLKGIATHVVIGQQVRVSLQMALNHIPGWTRYWAHCKVRTWIFQRQCSNELAQV